MAMKRIITLVIFVIGLAVSESRAQQNVQFTQYIFNSMSVNPAYTGYKEEWFGQLGLRSQWVGLEGAPQTGLLSIDGIVDPASKRHGLGLQVIADKLGPQSPSSAHAHSTVRLRLHEDDTQRLSCGIGVGVPLHSLHGKVLHPTVGGEQAIADGKTSNWVPDERCGV